MRTQRNLHVERFIQLAIEKGGFDVNAVDGPGVILKIYDEEQTECNVVNNWSKIFGEINAGNLGVALANKARATFCVAFSLVDPTTRDDAFALDHLGTWNHFPHLLVVHVLEFSYNASYPLISLGAGHGLLVTFRVSFGEIV